MYFQLFISVRFIFKKVCLGSICIILFDFSIDKIWNSRRWNCVTFKLVFIELSLRAGPLHRPNAPTRLCALKCMHSADLIEFAAGVAVDFLCG